MGIAYPSVPGPETITTAMLAAKAVTGAKLGEGAAYSTAFPTALEEHTNASYEFSPSATKQSLVYLTIFSKASTAAQYKVLVGGSQIGTITIPAGFATSFLFPTPIFVGAGKSFQFTKESGEIEKSFTSIQAIT